jgi:putative zinc finger protein
MMISCKDASRLLSQAMDTRLPLGSRVRLRLHLLICDACTNFSRQLRLLRRAIARLYD